VETSGFLR